MSFLRGSKNNGADRRLVWSVKVFCKKRLTTVLIVGVDDVEGPPVPMPNTEVKLNGAEDT